MLPHDAWRGRHDFPAGPSAPSAVASVLMLAEHLLIGLPLALLLRCAARTIPATIDAALAIVALVCATTITLGLAPVAALLRGRRMLALVKGRMTLLLLASVVVVARDHCSAFRDCGLLCPLVGPLLARSCAVLR